MRMTDSARPSDGFDVAYVARLARLHLEESERAQLQGQLEQILSYVDALKEADVSGLAPMIQAVETENVLRSDEVAPGVDREAALANAPEHRLGLFIVPRILE